jgi:hypothetical protein
MSKQIYVSHIIVKRSPKGKKATIPYVDFYRDLILRLEKLNLVS